jgi:hypothetical protein
MPLFLPMVWQASGEVQMKDFFKPEDCDMRGYALVTLSSAFGPPSSSDCISLTKANALIAGQGKVVYGKKYDHNTEEATIWCSKEEPNDNRKALLVCVEPIEQADTAEKILQDLLRAMDRGMFHGYKEFNSAYERARKLLEAK